MLSFYVILLQYIESIHVFNVIDGTCKDVLIWLMRYYKPKRITIIDFFVYTRRRNNTYLDKSNLKSVNKNLAMLESDGIISP